MLSKWSRSSNPLLEITQLSIGVSFVVRVVQPISSSQKTTRFGTGFPMELFITKTETETTTTQKTYSSFVIPVISNFTDGVSFSVGWTRLERK